MAMVRDVNTEEFSKMKFCHIQCMNMTEIQKNYILKCTQWESNPRPFARRRTLYPTELYVLIIINNTLFFINKQMF